MDITAQKFGRLTVVDASPKRSANGQVYWNCRCDCGGARVALGKDLRRGRTTSCGCKKSERAKAGVRVTHGATRGRTLTPIYRSWRSMLTRCYNSNFHAYHRYGGRGITVCDAWRSDFAAFERDMGPRPEGTTLDRYPDPDGKYEPGNCRWATVNQQRQNRGT